LFKSQCESNEIGPSMSTEKVEWGETLSFDFTKVKVGLTCAVKPLAVEDCQNLGEAGQRVPICLRMSLG
jgi:hypothetical protein